MAKRKECYPDGVTLWPPEPEEDDWTVIVDEKGNTTRTVFFEEWDKEKHRYDETKGYNAARAFALAEAARIGVAAMAPTRDGEMRRVMTDKEREESRTNYVI